MNNRCVFYSQIKAEARCYLHICTKVWPPLKNTTGRKQPVVTEMPHVGKLTPGLHLGNASQGLPRVPPKKEPSLRVTSIIKNHKNIEHLSSNSHCKYRL